MKLLLCLLLLKIIIVVNVDCLFKIKNLKIIVPNKPPESSDADNPESQQLTSVTENLNSSLSRMDEQVFSTGIEPSRGNFNEIVNVTENAIDNLIGRVFEQAGDDKSGNIQENIGQNQGKSLTELIDEQSN